MRSLYSVFLLFFWLALSIDAAAQTEYTMAGEYQGRDIYIQNPLSPDKVNFCTQQVYLNEHLVVETPKTSAFEVNLSHLKVGDPVFLKIIHAAGCQPKIINPQVIRSKSKFQFTFTKADANAISWSTSGELPDGKLYLEHYKQGGWEQVRAFDGRGSFEANQYLMAPTHHSGDNKYRVRYEQNDGKIFFSRVFDFQHNVEPVSFYPTLVTDKIVLSRESDYEVKDASGRAIVKGKSKEIILNNLKAGLYYLYVDNREERFVKK
jgi:hypothetical protein